MENFDQPGFRSDDIQTPKPGNPWWLKPPGLATYLITGVLFLWICWYSLLPIAWTSIAVWILWFLWLACWVLRIFLRMTAVPGTAIPISGMARMRWSSVPVVFAIMMIFARSGLGIRIGFELSRPAMNSLIQTALASPDRPPHVRWAGLYRIQRVNCWRPMDSKEWACEVALVDANGGWGGFYYAGPAAHQQRYQKETDLGGGWYSWAAWPT